MSDAAIDLTVDADRLSIEPPTGYEVVDIEGPVVRVENATYRSSHLGQRDSSEVREALEALAERDEFQAIVDDCPTNTPVAYRDIDYLTRHLPEEALRKCAVLHEELSLAEDLVVLLAYVERQNDLIGHSDEVLDYYLQQRDDLTAELEQTGSVDGAIERSLFSYLLLASALAEELTLEITLHELFREEVRLAATADAVSGLGHATRLKLLCDTRILADDDHGDLVEIKRLRNDLVHDPRRRADGITSRDRVVRIVNGVDRCVDTLLTLSGKDVESAVARKGCGVYIDDVQERAVTDTVVSWDQRRAVDLRRLEACPRATVSDLRWSVENTPTGSHDVRRGFDFEGLDDSRLYRTVQAFVDDASDAMYDRITTDANRSNLGRFDFALLTLLCADHDYETVAQWLCTTPDYVQRKENVLARRASEFERQLLGPLPRPTGEFWGDSV